MIDTLPLLPGKKSRQFDSRYRVVHVAAQRTKQIMQSGQQVQTSKYAKETSVALEEVLRGDVDYLIGQEARQAIRESKRPQERGVVQALTAKNDEEAKEIQQQLDVYIDDSPNVAEPTDTAE